MRLVKTIGTVLAGTTLVGSTMYILNRTPKIDESLRPQYNEISRSIVTEKWPRRSNIINRVQDLKSSPSYQDYSKNVDNSSTALILIGGLGILGATAIRAINKK